MRVASVERDRSVESSVSSRVPKERKRFTPWLEDQINQGDINGLEWIEKEKGIFRVPWVRVDQPEFELETHAELFKRWAQHTGKYRQGDQPDPSTWKTRFRCALRKMQEIVEIKELGSLEGIEPYRVFKFKTKLKGLSTIRNSLHYCENRLFCPAMSDCQGYQPDQSTRKTRLLEVVEIKKLRRDLKGSKPYRASKFKPNMNGIVIIIRNNFRISETCRLVWQ